jgi:(1->4)-alpha-D-glucan 1-alpha-D-glucosylmutase
MQIPRATYRFQFNEEFRLADALALVPYLHELGVSHIYASPLFLAAPHSTHGYDVCDF